MSSYPFLVMTNHSRPANRNAKENSLGNEQLQEKNTKSLLLLIFFKVNAVCTCNVAASFYLASAGVM